jgi:hypothetical protein
VEVILAQRLEIYLTLQGVKRYGMEGVEYGAKIRYMRPRNRGDSQN